MSWWTPSMASWLGAQNLRMLFNLLLLAHLVNDETYTELSLVGLEECFRQDFLLLSLHDPLRVSQEPDFIPESLKALLVMKVRRSRVYFGTPRLYDTNMSAVDESVSGVRLEEAHKTRADV